MLQLLDVEVDSAELEAFLLRRQRISAAVIAAAKLRVEQGRLLADGPCDAYVAAAIADVFRQLLVDQQLSFSFETVMSHPSKVEFLARAQAAGYRTYLYFVATESPAINVHRIETRSALGGHAVPANKVVERYDRSLALLREALRYADRAYLFDNSGPIPVCVAEQTPAGERFTLDRDQAIPRWLAATGILP